MAENEVSGGVAEQETEAEFVYPATIEDVGPGAKKVSVEIPRERIDKKLADQFKELRREATIPGFRPGHAPQKLIEKRFSHDVREQVRSTLISESYQQVLEKNSLNVIGDPDFVDPEAIKKIPDAGPLTYAFQVEIQPEITLPELTGLKIKKPKISITDANIDQAMTNLRSQQGTLIPVEDRGIEAGDYVIADVHVKFEGNVVNHQHDAELVVRAARIGGIQIDDLAQQLAGMKPGETRSIHAKAPDHHLETALRGKDVDVEITLKHIRKMELAEVTPSFLTELGFESEQELREALREQMEERINEDIQRAMRSQVNKYLIENTHVELPAKLSDRQADRIVRRRGLELLTRGLPGEQVEAALPQVQAEAKDEAARELKLFFILQKLATEHKVDVSEAELNGRVAMIAIQSDRRPEKVKLDMSKDGSLTELYVQMREQKAVDKLLETAQVEEVEVTETAPTA